MRDTRLVRIWVGIVAFSIGLHGTIPLSSYYRHKLGASTGDITLLYSLYAFALIPALVVFGSSSDVRGRRRIVLPAMAVTTAASLLFATDGNLGVLFVARSLQGWATGMFWGASSAFLLDYVDPKHRLDASMVLSATFMGSIASGIFLFGAAYSILDSATGPWLLHAGLMVVAIALVATVPEPRAMRPTRAHIAVALPQPEHRRAFFAFITPLTFGLIGLGAYVVALGPRFVEEARPSSSVSAQGAAVALALAVGATAQVATRRLGVRRVTAAGAVLMPAGGFLIVAALVTSSLVLTVLGMAFVGIGMGLSFRGLFAMTELMTTAADRAGVISTFSIAFYLANALPVVSGGYAVAWLGLTTVTAVLTGFATAVAVYAYATNMWAADTAVVPSISPPPH
jgi:predicted MFS family arabinose efflux permease